MTAADLARALYEAIDCDPDGDIPASLLLRECERRGIEMGEARSPLYGIVRGLLAAERASSAGIRHIELGFWATQVAATGVRMLGNSHIGAVGRNDVVMAVCRDSRPPYGPGRSGRWAARFVPDERTPGLGQAPSRR